MADYPIDEIEFVEPPIQVKVIEGKQDLWKALDTSIHPDLEQAKQLVYGWYTSGMAEGYSCLIGGNVGCGKSHIARAIVEVMTPFKALFIEETGFVKHLQDSYGDNTSSELAIFKRLTEAELLVYDDLGAYQTSNLGWMENIYRMIFEHRLAHKKPVLFTTNLSFTEHDGGEFGLMRDHIGARNYDRMLRGIFTGSGPYYANLFNVPSYKSDPFKTYLAQVGGE